MKLFKLLGIQVQIHFSWWFIFALLTWSLAVGFFPQYYAGLSSTMYWVMGAVSAVLLFFSVVLHELSHSIVAKFRGIKVESITLFFFGGVAGIEDEDLTPKSEFLMAIAGPLFSLVLGGLFFVINRANGSVFVSAITFYLYQINFILAIFNLVPGFPLDGGRAFRAILHWKYKDIKKATRIASKGGKFFAGVLIFLGFIGLLSGTGGGLWFILLGGFLYFIAGVSYQQVLIKDVLQKIKVKELMKSTYITISPDIPFNEVLKKYLKEEQESFIVKKGKEFVGILNFRILGKIRPKLQRKLTVSSLVIPKAQLKMLHHDDDCYTAYKLLTKNNVDALPVVSGARVKGVLLRKSLEHRLLVEVRYGVANS